MSNPPENNLYCAWRIKLPFISYIVDLTYLEVLDETNIDFTQIHNCFEIYFCLDNQLTMNVGSRKHKLTPGEFLMIMPGTPHNAVYNPSEKHAYFVMMFEWPHIEKDTEQYYPISSRVRELASMSLAVPGFCPIEKINALLEKMKTEILNKDIGWHILFRGYCFEFLICCLREVIEPISLYPNETNSINDAIKITKYMHKNYNQKITIQDVAKVAHISPRHAQRIFTDFFGVSFNKALTLYRLNHAKNYLINTDLTIEEIARCVGLSSSQPLYKLFREHEHMSIGEYRKKEKDRLRNLKYEY